MGVIDNDFELARLEKALPLLIPSPDISVKVVNFKDNEILFVEIKEGKNKPIYVKNGQNTQAYIRAGDVNLPASKKTLKTFINGQDSRYYGEKSLKIDDRIVYNLFEQDKRLSILKIRELLNYSERRIKKILYTLTKRGLIVPSKNEKNVFYKTKIY